MSSRRSRHDFKVHGLRPNPCSSALIEGFRGQDVDGFSARVEFQKEVNIRIGTGIAPRGRPEQSDTPHSEILERGCDAPYEGCRFFGPHEGECSFFASSKQVVVAAITLASVLLGASSCVIFEKKRLPPGLEKKIEEDQNAKRHAPGQKKK